MRLESKTVQPASVVFSGKTQVYFDLNKNQEKAWKAGVLAIYFYDPVTKTWAKLSNPGLAWQIHLFHGQFSCQGARETCTSG